MSLSQAEARMLQQLRDDVDRLIANGRGDSRTGQTRGSGATVIRGYGTANGFTIGNGVYLDYDDNTWKKINGTSFAYEDYLWGIVTSILDVNKFSVTVNGEARVPGASFTLGAPYGFDASGVLSASAARPVVKATLDDTMLVGASAGSSGDGSITVDVTHTAHGFGVGTFLYRDDSTGLHARTDNTDPLKCDVRGFVSAVIDANNFTLTLEGWKTDVAGNTGTLYLSTGGNLTATAPTGLVIPVLYPVPRGGTFDGYFSSTHIQRLPSKACSILGRAANTVGPMAAIEADANGKIPNRLADAIVWTDTPQVIRTAVTFHLCNVNVITSSTTPPASTGAKGELHMIY